MIFSADVENVSINENVTSCPHPFNNCELIVDIYHKNRYIVNQ